VPTARARLQRKGLESTGCPNDVEPRGGVSAAELGARPSGLPRTLGHYHVDLPDRIRVDECRGECCQVPIAVQPLCAQSSLRPSAIHGGRGLFEHIRVTPSRRLVHRLGRDAYLACRRDSGTKEKDANYLRQAIDQQIYSPHAATRQKEGALRGATAIVLKSYFGRMAWSDRIASSRRAPRRPRSITAQKTRIRSRLQAMPIH